MRAKTDLSLGPTYGALASGSGVAALGFGVRPDAFGLVGALPALALGAPATLGAALAAAAEALAAAAACACRRAMFIMRTSFTRFAIVTLGSCLNDGIAPLPSLMVAAICSSVTEPCQAASDKFDALSMGPRGPSPRPSDPWHCVQFCCQATIV